MTKRRTYKKRRSHKKRRTYRRKSIFSVVELPKEQPISVNQQNDAHLVRGLRSYLNKKDLL
jgi:hypothetical protein